MDEETKKEIEELKDRIATLEQELSQLKDDYGNHQHNSEGFASHNY